jgi:hypothetical protein
MAATNPNNPRGLVPYRGSYDGYQTGNLGLYRIPSGQAANIFVGDPLVPLGTSDANGIPDVGIATAGASNYTIGPLVSIANGGDPVVPITRDLPVYHPASTIQYVLVAHDPSQMFWIQDDGTGLTVTSAGMKNANMQAGGGGSTVTGYSSWQLVASTIATTNTFQLRILRMLLEADDVPGVAYAKWLVKINLHSMLNLTGV